jgi:alpha-beta hydrolase superfamily lysophospholipase
MRSVEPFYFGALEAELFGAYHAPQNRATRACGVVLCQSMGEEYIRFHRACRHLAERLAMLGFPVLRFDWYGCGDSAGEAEQGRLARWRTDLAEALGEIRRRAGVATVCLFGVRLGGSLAMLVGAERGDVDSMVLWDPVISGTGYLTELASGHQTMLRQAHVRPQSPRSSAACVEILGFPLAEAMRRDLEGLDLIAIPRPPARRVLLMESHPRSSQEHLETHLQRLNVQVTPQHTHDVRLWTWAEHVNRVLVPHQLLQTAVSWVSEVYR